MFKSALSLFQILFSKRRSLVIAPVMRVMKTISQTQPVFSDDLQQPFVPDHLKIIIMIICHNIDHLVVVHNVCVYV